MTKTLTEQWREGTLPAGMYYIKADGVVAEAKLSRYNYFYNLPHGNGHEANKKVEEVLAPVPSYESLYNPNDGRIPVGLFTVLKLIKRDIERTQGYRNLTDLECCIKSQVVSLLKKWGVK